MRTRIEYLLKHNPIIQVLYKNILSTFFRLIGFFIETDQNLVLITSFAGKRYNDSPKCICSFLLNKKEYKNLKLVWAFVDPKKNVIPGCKSIQIDSWDYFITALKAKYWITNVNIERGLTFKKSTTRYLNTWHGIPFKLVGNAVSNRSDFDFSNVNVFCYSGNYEGNIYIKDFNVKRESLILSGLPRNDKLFTVNDGEIKTLRDKLGIPENKKVILYAPTWRDSQNNGRTYPLKPPLDFNEWYSKLGDSFIILFRAHSFTTELLGINFNNFVQNYSEYQDINDLLIVSDILISDYSATMFDYSILERPIISFAYDYDEYVSNRGFYTDLHSELPSGILKTQDEVIEKILSMDYLLECEKTKNFKLKYIQSKGNATKLCIEALFKEF